MKPLSETGRFPDSTTFIGGTEASHSPYRAGYDLTPKSLLGQTHLSLVRIRPVDSHDKDKLAVDPLDLHYVMGQMAQFGNPLLAIGL